MGRAIWLEGLEWASQVTCRLWICCVFNHQLTLRLPSWLSVIVGWTPCINQVLDYLKVLEFLIWEEHAEAISEVPSWNHNWIKTVFPRYMKKQAKQGVDFVFFWCNLCIIEERPKVSGFYDWCCREWSIVLSQSGGSMGWICPLTAFPFLHSYGRTIFNVLQAACHFCSF